MKALRRLTLVALPASRNERRQGGFTLVELSIVLVIIGLIIGGILKGQELISNAQVKNVLAQAQSYQAATVGFTDKYGALPGDLVNAGALVPNCTAAPCLVPASATLGNGFVGADVGATYGGDVSTGVENVAFWQQLGAGRFINGVQLGATSAVSYGGRFPSATTGGGFQIVYHNATGRHLVRLSGAVTAPLTTNGALRPDDALQMDTRVDDGVPTTGTVFTTATLSSNTTCFDPAGTTSYRAALQDKSCNLVFEIN